MLFKLFLFKSVPTVKPIFHCDAKFSRWDLVLVWTPNARIYALSPMPNLKFALPPTRNPKASQWNIGCVGSQTQISHVGHVHFMFLCVDFICVGYPRQMRFQWNMGFIFLQGISLTSSFMMVHFYISWQGVPSLMLLVM